MTNFKYVMLSSECCYKMYNLTSKKTC